MKRKKIALESCCLNCVWAPGTPRSALQGAAQVSWLMWPLVVPPSRNFSCHTAAEQNEAKRREKS